MLKLIIPIDNINRLFIRTSNNYKQLCIVSISSGYKSHHQVVTISNSFLLTIEYRLISKKGEGTFSEVLKAQSIKTGKYVAIKCMKNHFDTIEQINNLREI